MYALAPTCRHTQQYLSVSIRFRYSHTAHTRFNLATSPPGVRRKRVLVKERKARGKGKKVKPSTPPGFVIFLLAKHPALSPSAAHLVAWHRLESSPPNSPATTPSNSPPPATVSGEMARDPRPQVPDLDPEPPELDPVQTQTWANDAIQVRRNLSALYGLPESFLLSTVPPILQAVDDHVLFPLSPYWSRQRWVRVSNLQRLNNACYSAREILCEKQLKLFIMPYISPLDADTLLQLVENRGHIMLPGNLPDFMDRDNGEEDGCLPLPVEGRHGVLKVQDPAANSSPPLCLEIPFVVVNYGLLLSKSEEYKRFKSAAERAKTELDEIRLRKNQLLIQLADFVQPDGNMKHLEDATERAQEAVILSLVKHDVDPHNTIHQLDEETHDKIYGVGFDPCYPDVHNSKDLVESTDKRLQLYAHQLETSMGRQVLPPKLAKVEVLAAEGTYHSEHSLSGSIKSFQEVIEKFERELFTLISDLTLTSSKHSLIGVKGRLGSTENME